MDSSMLSCARTWSAAVFSPYSVGVRPAAGSPLS